MMMAFTLLTAIGSLVLLVGYNAYGVYNADTVKPVDPPRHPHTHSIVARVDKHYIRPTTMPTLHHSLPAAVSPSSPPHTSQITARYSEVKSTSNGAPEHSPSTGPDDQKPKHWYRVTGNVPGLFRALYSSDEDASEYQSPHGEKGYASGESEYEQGNGMSSSMNSNITELMTESFALEDGTDMHSNPYITPDYREGNGKIGVSVGKVTGQLHIPHSHIAYVTTIKEVNQKNVLDENSTKVKEKQSKAINTVAESVRKSEVLFAKGEWRSYVLVALGVVGALLLVAVTGLSVASCCRHRQTYTGHVVQTIGSPNS